MVTGIEDMKKSGGPKEVEISGWDNDSITVKLRRPSMYEMAAAGRIPNPLLPVADALFMLNGTGIERTKLDDLASMMELIAKSALVEPTYQEICEAGLSLTDVQFNEIYSFVVGGAATLAAFRHRLRAALGGHGGGAAVPAVGAGGDK